MRVQLFSVFDTKSRIYLAPFVARSQVDATRQIASSFRDPQMKDTPVGQNPEDFELFLVGSFDDESGDMSVCKPTFVANLGNLRDDSRGSTVSS
ncbi:nonstructural protein [Apis mellifera associated microvirus 4]|nr:nonstructural protein [Apis mellifera associated microvirus 4]AZL82757.1 nonstructural protein [Apis mellifera associated microvirus 4]AZL82798.1 nonstructural protein [Apis mellifera associated microvirus 4]AZL82903.1 nonstructural protein [Apis mellifera associated microvirus 4]